MVKVDLVTGFLGSGKTTFIKKYAKYLVNEGEHIGILENDFGAVNVDMLMLSELRSDNLELEMVAGGCDADCHRRRFKTKLISMAMSGYDRVIIEPSGIFDMDEFFDALREEPLDNWYEIANVFCIVDANLEQDLSEEAEYILASQLASAGKIIFSRVQETPDEVIAGTKEYLNKTLKSLSSTGPLGKSYTDYVRVLKEADFFIYNWEDVTDEELCKLQRSGFFVKDYVKKFDLDRLPVGAECFLEPGKSLKEMRHIAGLLLGIHNNEGDNLNISQEYGHIIRVKGFVQEDGKWTEMNATRHGISTRLIPQGQNVVIVIGENINKENIQKLFK